MSESSSRPMVPVAGHPGIFKRGARYIVVFRVMGKQRKRSFRTLTEARRFKGQTDLAPLGRQKLHKRVIFHHRDNFPAGALDAAAPHDRFLYTTYYALRPMLGGMRLAR